jgi:hypothetical protein
MTPYKHDDGLHHLSHHDIIIAPSSPYGCIAFLLPIRALVLLPMRVLSFLLSVFLDVVRTFLKQLLDTLFQSPTVDR